MDAEFINSLQETHIAIWNEKDRAKRNGLMEKIYAQDIVMYDKDFILHGQDEIVGFIEKLHTQDPNFHITAAKPIEFVQNGVRLFWQIKIGDTGMLHGMDFFVIENYKVVHLYAFMEANG